MSTEPGDAADGDRRADDDTESDPAVDDTSGDLDLGGLLSGLDMGALLGAAQSMQAQILEAQRQAAQSSVTGQAGGGVVRIDADGSLAFTAVHIAPEAIDPDDPTMLEDLVLAALHDVVARIEELHRGANPLAGLDLGGLGGLGGSSGGALGPGS